MSHPPPADPPNVKICYRQMMPSSFSLDELYKFIAYIYSEQNAQRPATATFAHFVEVCGMLTVHDRKKKREGVGFEDALCKAFGWYFPLVAKFRVQSLEELVFRKFPYACPYCRACPHDDPICKTVRGAASTVDHEALRDAYKNNRTKRPRGIDEWQRMFQKIYPRSVEEGTARSSVGLFEEVGELAEAVRVFERHPKYFAGEAADVFSYLMGLANEYAIRLKRDTEQDFSLEAELLKRYPGLCTQCGYSVCVCPLVPESTVGRMAKELDVEEEDLFSLKPDAFRRESIRVAATVVKSLGGHESIVENFPFDRGDANKAVIIMCLSIADAVEPEQPTVSSQLRAAAMAMGKVTTPAGSKANGSRATEIVDSIKEMLAKLPADIKNGVLHNESLESNVSQLVGPKSIRVLFVTANSAKEERLALAEEHRTIQQCILHARNPELIQLKLLSAATVDDLSRALLDQEFDLLHFSGHGSAESLTFQDEFGIAVNSPLEAIAELVKRHPTIKCVLLNSCESVENLKSPMAEITIGMESSVGDAAAVEFSRGFYDALLRNRGFRYAFLEGKNRAELNGRSIPVKIIP